MASQQQIQELINSFPASSNIDKQWVSWYLTQLPDNQAQAAIQAMSDAVNNGQVDGYQIGSAGVYAVQQMARATGQGDPASRLVTDLHKIPGWSSYRISNQQAADAANALRDYFKNDPFLKDHPDAQNSIVDQLLSGGQWSGGNPVESAKGINWGQRSLGEKAQFYGAKAGAWDWLTGAGQTSATEAAALQAGVALPSADYSALTKYVDGLPPKTQFVVQERLKQDFQKGKNKPEDLLSSAHQYAADDLVWQSQQASGSKQSDLVDQAKSQLLTGQSFNDQQAAQSAGQAPSSTSTPGQSIFNLQPGQGVNDQQKRTFELITGQKFDDAYSSFAQNYVIAVQQQNPDTGNVDPNAPQSIWTTETAGNTQPYLAPGWQATALSKSQVKGDPSKYKPSEEQYLAMQSQTFLAESANIEKAAGAYWSSQYGGDLPQDLKTQLYAYIQQQPVDVVAQWVQQGASYASTLATTQGDPIYGLITNYAAEHGVNSSPQAEKMTDEQSFIKQYHQMFGHDPDAATIRQALTMGSQAWGDWLNNMPNYKSGMSYNTYQNTLSNMNKAGWSDAFGSSPTDQQIAAMQGKSVDDVQTYVDGSPSHVSGWNVGQYKAGMNFADSVMQKEWGYADRSKFLSLLKEAGYG